MLPRLVNSCKDQTYHVAAVKPCAAFDLIVHTTTWAPGVDCTAHGNVHPT